MVLKSQTSLSGQSMLRHLFIFFIRIYQWTLSPLLRVLSGGNICRFEPTCSHYAVDALRKHGSIAGVLLATWRLLRCNPWGGMGPDPVPEKLPRWAAWARPEQGCTCGTQVDSENTEEESEAATTELGQEPSQEQRVSRTQ
jgi:hypothetical protein